MASALGGLTVVDLSWGFPGTIVSMFLADYGAEVIRIEPPGGDAIRQHPAFYMWHRGKKSVVLDLKQAGDLERARKLAGGADIVVQAYRPGVAQRLGLDYETLSRENPGLILASITGLGPTGEYAQLKGYDAIVVGKMGGFSSGSGLAPREGPGFACVPWAGFGASQTALQGILAALYVREKTGVGQLVEATLVQGLSTQDPWGQIIEFLCEKYPEAYRLTPAVPVKDAPFTDYIFRLLVAMTKDGRWLQFSQTSPHLWDALVKALDMEEIYQDPGFKTAPTMETYEDSVRFWDLMLNKIRAKTLAEWERHFEGHPNVGAELFRTAEEGMDHPQMHHNRHLIELDDPRVGRTVQLAPMVRLFETPGEIKAPAPELGQHNDELLRAVESGGWKPALAKRGQALPAHALEGVTVVELALFYASAFGVTLLADLGARVIKLEQLRGDDIRYAMPIPETGAVKVLQGKESVALDLDTPEGQEIAHAIIAKADMVMMGFRGGVAQRLRVDYQTLKAINPHLIYLNAPGYGIDGPFARKPAYAPTIGAGIGAGVTQAGRDVFDYDPAALTLDQIKAISMRLRAGSMGPGNADGVSSQAVGTALLLGLIARERTGVAQEMLTSMLCSTAYANSADMIRYEGKKPAPAPDPLLYGLGARYRLYQTSDSWLFLACPQESEWPGLCSAVAQAGGGGVDLADDPRFADAELRRQSDAALAETLERLIKTKPAQEWERIFQQHDISCTEIGQGAVSQFIMKDPAMAENGFLTEVDHPVFGPHPRMAPVSRLSRTPGVARPGVALGQHTEAVLKEFGYSDEAIEKLEAAKVIRRAS